MKKSIAVFLLAALTLTVLAGCQSVNAEAPIPNFDGAASIVNLQMQKSVTPTTTVPKVTTLTPQEAEAIALTHAELKAEDVRMERTELDRDDGILHYDVEFTAGDFEYDYEIDAVSGEVLRWDREYEPKKNTDHQPPASQPEVPVTQPEATMLTAEEAEAIALAHAELTAEDVRMKPTELDRDDGILHYDVEFTAGDFEYDYEIDAVSGEVLRWDREYEPKKNAEPQPPVVQPETPATQPEATMLTAEEAESIALDHAGLKAEEVRFDKTERDREHGILVYEVEFRVGNWEYSYEIDAYTGEILEWEKEFDD